MRQYSEARARWLFFWSIWPVWPSHGYLSSRASRWRRTRPTAYAAYFRIMAATQCLSRRPQAFFGIVSWSEVGLSYFGVSTAILLIFPQCIGWLALVNLLCLPFTFWSIWYQRFRLHTWCTLCVTTQALLWLQAGSYLWAGAWHHQLSSGWSLAVIAAAYGAALLALNRLTTFIKHHRGAES